MTGRDNDPTLKTDASILIDTIGGRRGQGISTNVRLGADAVRRVRNHWCTNGMQRPRPCLSRRRVPGFRFSCPGCPKSGIDPGAAEGDIAICLDR